MRILLTALLSVLSVFPASAESGAKRYIIGFKPEATAAQRGVTLKTLGAQAVESFDELGAVAADVPQASAVGMLDADDLNNLSVSFIEEDFYINWLTAAAPVFEPMPSMAEIHALAPVFRRAAAPQNALPPGVEAAEVPWGILRVNAASAWDKTEGGGVRVAVIDTGIDAAHPDLVGQVAGGYNAVDKDQPYFDDNNHGTHVSGTIAARRDGKGVVGVAPKVQLFAVKVLDKNGGGSLTSVIKGIVWCARHDIQVANMSLGSPMGSIFMRLAVKYAAARGVTLVAAAGNSGGSVGYPAAYSEAISVSASDAQDKIASFSSRGSRVDFIAPGVAVKSSVPNGGYDSYSGTSMATPHVAGLAALAVSRGAKTPDAVRAALAKAAKTIGLAPVEQGRGMIDAALLVQ